MGALAAHDPLVVGLVGIAFVFGKAIAIVIVFAEILERFLHGGPGASQEFLVFAASEDEIAINYQDKLGIQVFPAIGVLPTELINLLKGIFVGNTQIVGNRAFGFTDTEAELAGVAGFPNPFHFFAGFLRDGGGEFAHHIFFEVGPEFEEGHGAAEAEAERFAVGIGVALHDRLHGTRLRKGADGAAPEGAEIGERIQLVEEHAAIPERLAFVIDVGRLPSIDGLAPGGGILAAVARGGPRRGGAHAVVPVAP